MKPGLISKSNRSSFSGSQSKQGEVTLQPWAHRGREWSAAIGVTGPSQRVGNRRIREDRCGQIGETPTRTEQVGEVANDLSGMWRNDRCPAKPAALVMQPDEPLGFI